VGILRLRPSIEFIVRALGSRDMLRRDLTNAFTCTFYVLGKAHTFFVWVSLGTLRVGTDSSNLGWEEG